jgi:sec-independent protein translocase protein TatA
MNFFGIGLPELAVIAAIGLLVFGPKRLPELGRTLGRTLKGFQSASSEFEKEFRTAISTVETTAAIPPADPGTPDAGAPAALTSEPVDGLAPAPAQNPGQPTTQLQAPGQDISPT